MDGSGSGPADVGAGWAHFLQGELGWEHHSKTGLLVRLTLGVAAMLNPGSLRCTSSSVPSCIVFTSSSHQEILPTLDLALGQTF